MADNTKIGPIFRGANGGISDDLFTGIKNSYYYSNDMEIREDAKSIFPKPIPAYADSDKNVEIGTGYDKCKSVTLSDHDGWIVCGLHDIYSVTPGTRTKTLLCSLTEEICDLEIFNNYIYISTKQHLYYKKDDGNYWSDMASSTDDSATNYGRCTESLKNNTNHPLYATDICLCVGNCNRMMKVQKETPSLLEEGFKIQDEYYIRFINELGGYVRVTAVDEPYGSEILLWDKTSDAIQETIPLEGYSMLGSAIYNGYHYLLSNRGLGLLNGYQYYLLKKAEGGDLSTSIRNCMCVYDDKLFFVTSDKLYIYGAKNKNYADVLSVWHECEDGYTYGAIGGYIGGIMITRNGEYQLGGIMVGLNEGKATTGEVQTMCYYGTSMSEIKQSMYLRVGYHIAQQGDNSGNIHIYYRTEADATTDVAEDWQWHEVTNPAGLTKDWDMRSPFATTLKLNCRFQWIQFKFVLTNCVYDDSGVTKTKDTNLYSADLYYNVMLD